MDDQLPYKPEFLKLLKKAEESGSVQEPLTTYKADIPLEREDVRHTFIIRKDLLEKIRDYAYMQHLQGRYHYGQRDVLEEILDHFFHNKMLVPRPDFIRIKEQARVESIKKGVKKV